jgi:hypothetical protein
MLDFAGKRILERTTLTQKLDDTVRQLIESSRDGGHTWAVKYAATYRRSGPSTEHATPPL